jgi:hypothetical protein
MAPADFDWSQYLALANELGQRSDAASLRTAISRGYYYVYHLALQRAKKNGFIPAQGEAVHTQLWRLFNASPEADCRKLAQIGERLKRNRVRADYQPIFVRLADETDAALAEAKDFATRLGKLDPVHPTA